jgi:hypothetical protein
MILFDRKEIDKKLPNILGWSLAVSDIICNDIGLAAISYITDEDMNPKGIEKADNFLIVFDIIKQSLQLFVELFIHYCLVFFFLIFIIFLSLPTLFSVFFLCLFVLFNLYYYVRLCMYYYVIHKDDVEQFRLPWISSKGMIQIFKFSFNDPSINTLIHKSNLGGVIGFLKNSKNTSNDGAVLVCTNYIKIQKINIKLGGNKPVFKESSYLLPENLFKELKSVKDAKLNWEYLSKSRYQEFLMVDTNYKEQIQNIEIYDVNTSQLVNIFYRHREKDSLISRNNEPGIFAISTDSRLFAYSYGDNIITIYLIESGLEVVSKKFDNINKIKFLEFIENDKKLFIIEEGEESENSNESFIIEDEESDVKIDKNSFLIEDDEETDTKIEKDKKLFFIEKDNKSEMKFHIWLLSGCLNDYFSISKDDIGLSDNNISTLSKYNEHYNTLAKANGKVVFLNNKDDENHFKILSEISIEKAVFKENDSVIYGFKYYSRDLEPWNKNSTKIVRGRFLNNDKRFILIKGQNSIQLWKSKSIDFVNFNNFKNFENSNLIYILISDSTEHSKFQIKDDMQTIITHACKSLAYLYKNSNSINYEECQKFISGITNIIKDFIKKYPDNWKLMEVQYPLMAYLIYSRSFSLIKHILIENAEKLHKPQSNYDSYPCYGDLELNEDLGGYDLSSTNDLELALEFCQG